MSKEIRLRDTLIYPAIMEILLHYKCPTTCSAVCCKTQDIEMDGKDRKILRGASKILTDNLRTKEINGMRLYTIPPPCPFLTESDICSAYDRRPTVCRIFPFNMNPEYAAMNIYPCDIGINICEGLFEYTRNVLGEDVPLQLIDDLKIGHSIFYDEDNDTIQIPLVAIDVDSLIEYSIYLKSNKTPPIDS